MTRVETIEPTADKKLDISTSCLTHSRSSCASVSASIMRVYVNDS